MSTKLHVVMMQAPSSEFKYLLGVFTSGRKAEIAAQYELQRRRSTKMPGVVTPKIKRIEVDEIYSKLDVNTLDDLLLNRV
tara:strand:- start:1379 stop:1618 length:240 start_codon:yes stop_codon:yes gene_type:complete